MKKKLFPTVAITGASGFLGSELVAYFANKHWDVVGLVRNAKQRHSTVANIAYREYDITRPVSKEALQGVDYLVHAAYIKFDAAHPYAMKVNVTGAKNLLAASETAHVKQSVFISTMSAHQDAISVYGLQKLEIEELFIRLPHTTVLRCGLIIGNGGIVREMAAFMQSKHVVPLIGGGRQPLQIIAVSDLVRSIGNVCERSLNGRYVIATPQVYSYRAFYQTLAQHLQIKVILLPLPYWALQAGFKFASLLHIPLGVGEDNLKGLKMLRKMESKDDLQRIGIKPLDLEKALLKANLK